MKTVFIKKVVLDQLCFAPIAIAGVTVLVALIDGKTKRDIEYKLKQDYFHILIANYKVSVMIVIFCALFDSCYVCRK